MNYKKKLFNQPAKLAERVIAPGEAAEPGETETKMVGAHEVGDGCNVQVAPDRSDPTH